MIPKLWSRTTTSNYSPIGARGNFLRPWCPKNARWLGGYGLPARMGFFQRESCTFRLYRISGNRGGILRRIRANLGLFTRVASFGSVQPDRGPRVIHGRFGFWMNWTVNTESEGLIHLLLIAASAFLYSRRRSSFGHRRLSSPRRAGSTPRHVHRLLIGNKGEKRVIA